MTWPTSRTTPLAHGSAGAMAGGGSGYNLVVWSISVKDDSDSGARRLIFELGLKDLSSASTNSSSSAASQLKQVQHL
ncbi:MAG: hypothetical protein ACLUOJ_04850 [Streptococcus salivarius]